MCGRYTLFIATEQIYRYFGIANPPPEVTDTDLKPSWNVAPQTMQPVIRQNPHTSEREMVLMRWGLVPFFSKQPVHSYSTINARAETILDKPIFREPMRRRRCLVPVNSYFEWQVIDPDTKKKRPWAIGLASGEPFGLAGIWDHWENQDRTIELETFAIITCEPNALLRPLYDRMPVLIHPDDYQRWLEPGDPNNPPMDLLRPFPDALMNIWRVKPAVGNTRNNRPDLIDPIDLDDSDNSDDPDDTDDQPRLF